MIHEESISHLAEIYGQSNKSLKKMMDKNWVNLHIWSDFLSDVSDEQQIKKFLKKIKHEVNFKNFYFINREGSYKTADDEIGFIELKSGLSELIISKNDIAVNSVVPGQPQIIVFATPVSKSEFQGFEYEAIGISYDNEEIVNEMKVSSFDGNSSSFIIHADSRVIIENTLMEHHGFNNFLAMLKDFSTFSETQILKLRDDFKNGKSISTTIEIGGEQYYFLTESAHFDDWMIVNLVPVSIVNASMIKLQYSTMLLVFFIMIGLAVFMISVVIRRNQIKLHKKDKQILYRDELFSKLSESVDDVFLMLDAENFRVDYVSSNIDRLLGITQKKIKINFKKIEKIVKKEDNPLVLNELSLMKPDEKETNLVETLHDIKTIISGQIHAKQIELYMDVIDVTDENIYCDRTRLNQVLINLLSNAIKFSKPGGTVSVRIAQLKNAAQGKGLYEIRVKDNGIGMSKEFASKIFEPFERERTSTVSRIQGTDLVMAITKNIIDMMGGTIEVFTEKDKGTEFVIKLEFKLQDSHHLEEKIQELEGLRALVVDDDFNTCDSVTKMLVKVGMRSEWTLSGKEAVLRARQSIELNDAFHAYIIDWRLPDMNGIEVTRQIGSLGNDAPIIILTAYDWADIEMEAKAAGVTAFCSKPMFMSDLRDSLLTALGHKKEPKKSAFPDKKRSTVLKGKNFLLVEDNELNREIAYELLKEYGFNIKMCENGKQAIDIIKSSETADFDIIFMDIQMPIMDGYEATRQIRLLPDKKFFHSNFCNDRKCL